MNGKYTIFSVHCKLREMHFIWKCSIQQCCLEQYLNANATGLIYSGINLLRTTVYSMHFVCQRRSAEGLFMRVKLSMLKYSYIGLSTVFNQMLKQIFNIKCNTIITQADNATYIDMFKWSYLYIHILTQLKCCDCKSIPFLPRKMTNEHFELLNAGETSNQ